MGARMTSRQRAGKGWSNGVIKSQTSSTKLQTNFKLQYLMTKTGLEFRILVIVICLIFEICDLEFLFLQYSMDSGVGQIFLT
jgi:hypothetical protein